MKPLVAALLVALFVAPTLDCARGSDAVYTIDLGRYFASASKEADSRARVLADAKAFTASASPSNIPSLLRWLQQYDSLLEALERHDIYVYLRAEEDDRDTADATADEQLGDTEDLISARLVDVARELGGPRIASLTQSPQLHAYGYLLRNALARASHQLTPEQRRNVELEVTPELDSAASAYKALRKSNAAIASNQDAFAALLVKIAAARNGVARLRGFSGAADASYFDKEIDPASVERTLAAVRASSSYARYRAVADKAPKTAATPAPLPVSQAIPLILAAERPMGSEYAGAYAELLDPANRRLEICAAPQCDDTGFSVGFAGVDSAVYYGGYDGSTRTIRALAHESGHAVHRQFMARHQPIAAYNRGPAFMFESFAIFNELLFLDHLYRSAANDSQRAYYLNYFLEDATFQVYGSAKETALESAIYRGVDGGSIRDAADLNALTATVFAQYDPAAAQDPATTLYWARDRLFYTDPLYDVNYLYAGLLALAYFDMFERGPQTFSPRYVALLKNGFNDSPAALERRFLGIDLSGERGLVESANRVIDARTGRLAALYALSGAVPRSP